MIKIQLIISDLWITLNPKKFLIHWLSEWVSEIMTTREAIASKKQEYHKKLFIDNYVSHKS